MQHAEGERTHRSNGAQQMPDLAHIATIAELLLQLSSLLNGVSSSRVEEINGWSIREWSEWGQKKYAIASATAKTNGELKRKISELEKNLASIKSLDLARDSGIIASTSTDIADDLWTDPFSKFDPWVVPRIPSRCSP